MPWPNATTVPFVMRIFIGRSQSSSVPQKSADCMTLMLVVAFHVVHSVRTWMPGL